MEPSPAKPGKVYLVGGGPGDPGLLTLRGRDCLARADAVLYDYLVNPAILAHAPAGAQLICLGRHGRDRIMSQEEINARLIELAREGQTVVRLKGGDPIVFAHAVEEVEALVATGIPYEIVPGITAALAAGSYAGIPLTHGRLASAVALVTGQERPGKESPGIDYRALAAFPGTLVFYMGVTTAREWTSAIVAAGKDPATAAVILRRCSWPDQEMIRCTLGTVADELERRRLRPPAIVVVGPVVELAGTIDWFARRPLFGTRILITRPEQQAGPLRSELWELGADVLVQPVIEISVPPDWAPVDRAIARLSEYDWLVFSSANGVRYLLDRIWQTQRDLRALAGVRLAAIGPGTAEELSRYRLRADFVPMEYRAESLAEGLSPHASGARFLLARASRGREVLGEQLRAAGGHVDQVVVYSSTDVQLPQEEVAMALAAGSIDWITVTSSAIARSLVALFGPELHKSKLVSISPITSATLRELGYNPAAEARAYTTAGVIQAILENRGTPSSEWPGTKELGSPQIRQQDR